MKNKAKNIKILDSPCNKFDAHQTKFNTNPSDALLIEPKTIISELPQNKINTQLIDKQQILRKERLAKKLKLFFQMKHIDNENQPTDRLKSSQVEEDSLINLNNYILLRKENSNPSCKLYQIKDKITHNIFHAKVLQSLINSESFLIIHNIFISIKNKSKLYHPCLLKYIGYSPVNFNNKPKPTIITEYTIKFSLYDLLQQSNLYNQFNDTHQLIVIYGLASAMSCLHQQNIINPNFEPSNILFDIFLLPKISNYSDSLFILNEHQEKMQDSEHLKKSNSIQKDQHYMAPETLKESILTKKSNVYSFGIIVYEIITKNIFKNDEKLGHFQKKKNILPSYQKLIESCLLNDKHERPTFDDILQQLKNDSGFMTEKINKKDFNDFVNYIDECKDKNNIKLADKFINIHSDTFNLKALVYDENSESQIKGINQINKEPTKRQNLIDIKRFYKTKYIGHGSFGKVFQVKERSTDKIFAAKIINASISSDYNKSDEALNFFREIKLMSALNHPSIIGFVGYSPVDFQGSLYPTTIIEFASNGTLRDILNLENKGLSPKRWDETQKLITIYGIAVGMLHLHSNDIIHRDLKPENIFMDDYLHPKIADFGLAKAVGPISYKSLSLTYQSAEKTKGSPQYMSPESLSKQIYSKPNDVFAFSILVYELLTLKRPYSFTNYFELLKKVVIDDKRPVITQDIPEPFQVLLTKCWHKDPNERPTFAEIVEDLKNNKKYLQEYINEIEYYDYIDFIDNTKNSFNLDNSIKFKELADGIDNIKSLKKINIHKKSEEEEEEESENFDTEDEEVEEENVNDKTLNIKIFDSDDESTIIEKAKLYFQNILEENNDIVFLLYGKILQYEKQFEEAKKMIKKSAKEGNSEAMFEYGKILFCEKNEDKAMKYFNHSSEKGFVKSKQFLMIYQKFIEERKFHNLKNKKIQFFLISQIIKNDFTYDYFKSNELSLNELKEDEESPSLSIFQYRKQVKTRNCIWKLVNFKITKTEEFLNNNIFAIPNFISVLKCFETVLIHVNYPSELFDSIMRIFKKYLYKVKGLKISLTYINHSKNKINDGEFARSPIIFENNEIPNSITKIGKNAFKQCSSLTQLTIPSSVKSIGENAFEDCSSLETIVIPSSITEIKNGTFKNCSSLTQITLPSSINSIGDSAFYKCSSLANFTFPSSLTVIRCNTFGLCSSLKQITIPSSIVSIEEGAFVGCKSLIEITIPSSITVINKGTFYECSSLKQITIPTSIISIKEIAFRNCSSLTEITIPSSITIINKGTFRGCSSLTKIIIPDSVTSIREEAFSKCSSLRQITIPSSINTIERATFKQCSSLRQITIPSSVTSINESAFNYCRSLTEIEIPSSVTSISKDAFGFCSSLKQIIIPSSIKLIDEKTFDGCTSLTQITIPSSLYEIGRNAFEKCESLKQITIPSFVFSIGEYAFLDCVSLLQIIIPSPTRLVRTGTFFGCSSLTQITLHSSVTVIGNKAFEKCSSLKEISLPSSIKSIGSSSFSECSLLTKIIIPPLVKSIEESTFSKCSSLIEIIIPSSVTVIKQKAFSKCSSLKQIAIPPSVTSIGNNAFEGCSSLTQITIPSSFNASQIGITPEANIIYAT